MYNLVLVIHVLLAIGLIGFVLLQRSEGGVLSGLGGGGGGGGLVSGRGVASFITRATAALMAGFIATSILLAILTAQKRTADPIAADRNQPAIVDSVPDLPPLAPPAR